jgi:3-oxoacyl-[acyl-carrier protein] reductase
MDLGLSGKVALVAASSQGLGRAVARELAREGCAVAINARTAETLAPVCDELLALGAPAVHMAPGDLSDRVAVAEVVASTRLALGPIDILVTNSGGPAPGLFEVHDDAAWDAAYRQLLSSAVGLVRGVLPDMRARRWGRIVCITSQAVKQPVDGLILSNSVRSSVVGLVRTLANELGADGITVNNVMPGFTRTARMAALTKADAAMAGVERDIPLGRMGEPEEFAAAVAFLCSARASYITGISLAVDGGWIRSLL